jgi:cytochrome P450
MQASSWPLLDKFLKGNPLLKLIKYKPSPFTNFSRNIVTERLEQAKTEPLSDTKKHPDLLGHFIAAKRTYPDVVTDSQILIYSGSNVAAGALATSGALNKIILFLASQPSAQDRLYEEIKAAERDVKSVDDADTPAAFERAIKMPYLESIITESYRCQPAISVLLERVVSPKGLDLPSGHHIPPGTVVGINSPAINRRTDIHGADAETFNPMRWMRRASENEEEHKQRKLTMERAMMTFGYGARSCIGKNIVQLELYKCLATLMGLFKVCNSKL